MTAADENPAIYRKTETMEITIHIKHKFTICVGSQKNKYFTVMFLYSLTLTVFLF